MTAGKLQFYTLFPRELSADELDEASVEFYFHIYNLLGDPELNFWKAAPQPLSAAHVATLSAGSNYLEVTVEDAGAQAVAGARVGVVQADQLLGCVFSDAVGVARLPLLSVSAGTTVAVTVTCPGIAEGVFLRRTHRGARASSRNGFQTSTSYPIRSTST